MTATMKCPGCQAPLRVRDDMAGKKIKCPRCAHVLTIPAAPVEALDEVPASEEITSKPAAKAKSREVEPDEDAPVEKRSKYKPCPRCGEEGAKRVKWTPWGSFYGPAMFTHVRCPECGCKYNGKSGRSNLIPAIVFVSIPTLFILGILAALGWWIHHLGYF